MKNLRVKKCPSCRKPVEWSGNEHRPFCSKRCRTLDLGNWASEKYRIAGEAVSEDECSIEFENMEENA